MVAIALSASLGLSVAHGVELEPILDAIERGDMGLARDRVSSVLDEHPDHPGGRFLEARLAAEGGDTRAAIGLFEALIADYPEIPEPYNNLAALHAEEGKLDRARDILEDGLATSDAYATLYQNLSTVYVEMARQSYAKALRLEGEETEGPSLVRLDSVHDPLAGEGRAAMMAAVSSEDEAPAPKPATSREPIVADEAMGGEKEEAAEVLRRWARAWSAQDVDSYLGYYTEHYSPEGMSRPDWRMQRDQRLSAPDWIEVQLSGVQVYDMGNGEMEAVVRQDYTSNTYSSLSVKAFTMVRETAGWRIVEEKTLRDMAR